jgi:agmatinase
MCSREAYQPAWNFLGLPRELAAPDRARAWVMPIPYESTTSYGAGTRNGPAAIIAASRQVELFDREFDCEPSAKVGFHTLDPLHVVRTSPEAMVGAIERAVAELLTGSPAPATLIVLGGEHSVTPGVVRGFARALGSGDLAVVQIDAHADLRTEYELSPHSHACVARRILETCPVFQIGVRNISQDEERFRASSKRVTTWFDDDVRADPRGMLDALAGFVRGRTIFLTIDLDGLDPAIMPAVGTPEPGGLGWHLTLDVARTIARNAARVPGFDVVELAPIPGMAGAEFLAAKLAYKVASLIALGPGAASR